MSLAILISLNAVVRALFHHCFDWLHIQWVGTAFSAAHSMQVLMNLTVASSSSGVAQVHCLFSICWIEVSYRTASAWSSWLRALVKSSSMASFQLYLALAMFTTDSLGSPSVNVRALWSERRVRSGFTEWLWTTPCPISGSFANVRSIIELHWVPAPLLVCTSLSLQRLKPWPSSQSTTS